MKISKKCRYGLRALINPAELTVSEILGALDGSYQIEKEELPVDSHGQGIAVSI